MYGSGLSEERLSDFRKKSSNNRVSVDAIHRPSLERMLDSDSEAKMKRYRVPKNNTLMWRVAIELIALIILTYPMMHIYIFLQGSLDPYKRGFFCDDESLKHPNLPEEIPDSIAFLIWAVIVLTIVPGIELLHVTVFEHHTPTRISKIPWVFVELYRILGYFTFGAFCTLLATEMAKFKVGRLRPYFLTVCDLDLTDDLCKDRDGHYKFVEDYHCKGDEHEVREATKSFFSGHSSFSFYTATFLIVYLHARLRRLDEADHAPQSPSMRSFKLIFRGLKILRPFLQFGIFALAFYIVLTRISDYKHHPGDVLVGIVVGIVFACILLLFLVDIFQKPRIFRVESCDTPEATVVQVDAEDGHATSAVAEVTEVDGSSMPMKARNNRSAPASRSNSDSRTPLAPSRPPAASPTNDH